MARIEADVRTLQLAVVLSGGKSEWPDVDERVADLESFLASEPKQIDADELALRDALGLRRPGA